MLCLNEITAEVKKKASHYLMMFLIQKRYGKVNKDGKLQVRSEGVCRILYVLKTKLSITKKKDNKSLCILESSKDRIH